MRKMIAIIKKYYMFFQKYKVAFTILILSTIFASIAQFMSPFYLGKIVDAIEKKSFLEVKRYIFILIAFFVMTMFFSIIETYISSYLDVNIKTKLEKYLFNRVIKAKLDVLDRLKGSEIINRLEEDTHAISSFYITKLSDYIIEIIKLSLSIILLFIISAKISSIALILVPLNFISTIILSKKTRIIQRQIMEVKDKNRSYIQEIVLGIREIKNLIIEKQVNENFCENVEFSMKLTLRQTIISTMSNSINSIASFGINLILIIYSGWLIIKGDLTLGSFIAFNSYLGYFLSAVQKIWNMPIDIQSLIISDERINEIMQYELEEHKEQDSDEDVRGDILFKNVQFGYKNTNELVLNNLNLKIQNNNLTAIIGENGAGKTTVLNLLNRFYDDYSGSIYIGEKNIKDISFEQLRRNITYIQQDVFLFSKTIRENLTLGMDNVSDDEIIKACKEVNIHDYIESLPNKYDTIVENDGKLLSGGQKQKLAIVRGLIRNTPIFLMDEVNKGLDIDSAQKLISIIKGLSHSHTVVMISHNESFFEEADIVIPLKSGTVMEETNNAISASMKYA